MEHHHRHAVVGMVAQACALLWLGLVVVGAAVLLAVVSVMVPAAPGQRPVARVSRLGSAVDQSVRRLRRWVTCWSPDGKTAGGCDLGGKAAGGCDVEAQLSSTDASGGNEEASVNASDILKGSDEAATPPPAVPSDAALAGSRGGALYCAYLVATFVLTGSATICVWWGTLLTLLLMVVWHLCLLPDLKRWLWRRRVDAQMPTEQALVRAEQAEVDALLANMQVATERAQQLHVVLAAVDATITDLSVTQQAVARHFGLPTGDDCDGATPAETPANGRRRSCDAV